MSVMHDKGNVHKGKTSYINKNSDEETETPKTKGNNQRLAS